MSYEKTAGWASDLKLSWEGFAGSKSFYQRLFSDFFKLTLCFSPDSSGASSYSRLAEGDCYWSRQTIWANYEGSTPTSKVR